MNAGLGEAGFPLATFLFGVGAFYFGRVLRDVVTDKGFESEHGRRGEIRRKARELFWFRWLEGPLRLSGLLAKSVFESGLLKARTTPFVAALRRKLLIAGLPLGLSAHEFIGLVGLLGVLLSGLGFWLFSGAGRGGLGGLLGLGLSGLLPFIRLEALYAERARSAMREIPRSMDLAGLCMSAGMDFTAALRTVVATDSGTIAEELRELLRGLELGITRKAALIGLMERLPCLEVRDFCRAVIQADEKGASLASALTQQARLCRMRRSLRAEENAARAAVLLIGPMMLLLVAILLVLIGPLFVGGVGF